MSKRLDVILVERGLVANLEEAKRLIMAGKVLVNGQKVDKPGKHFSLDSPLGRGRGWVSIEIQEDMPYVSRGGLKLEKALRDFNIDVRGKVAIDIGASTGGFTDCLLQHGAKFVYAVDVGYGQLAWKLRHDPRVKVLERTNIRYVQRSDFDKRIELATIDVSFISLRKVLPVVATLFNGSGEIIALVKPQFEANRHLVEKGGVVKDPEVHKQVIIELINFSTRNGFTVAGLTYSPITGPAGNIEYFIYLKLGQEENNIDVANVVPQIIHEAHITLTHDFFTWENFDCKRTITKNKQERKGKMPKAICIGELLIDFATEKKIKVSLAELIKSAKLEELMMTLNFGWAPGGAPANVSVGLAKLGIDCGFIGKIGDDPFGDILRKTLEDYSVDTSYLKQEKGTRTTLAFVATREDESKDIFFYRNPGADILLRADEIDASYIASAEVFHWGSVSLSHSPSREAVMRAIQIAADNGLLMSYDPNWRPTLWDAPEEEAKDLIWQTMRFANVAKLAEEEWEFITGTTDLDEGSKKLLDVGVNLVVVTRGKEGCYYNDGVSKGYIEGFKVKVIDPLGAGDGFVAAMLFKLMQEKKSPLPPFGKGGISDSRLREIMVYANAAGALTCMKPGVIPALPTAADIERFLSEKGFKY